MVIKALTSGTVYNLGIYYYDYSTPSPQLLYRMADVPITAGQYIQVMLDRTTSTSEDRQYGGNPSFDITTGGAGGQITGLGGNTNIWEVYSPVSGISGTDGIIMISYDLNATPADVMCYSNRDGDVAATFMQWGLKTLYKIPAAYNLGGQLPVDGVNDSYIQAHCSNFKDGSNSGLVRSTDTNNGSDFYMP